MNNAHLHCKCMNLDKLCPNNHYVDCTFCHPHKPEVQECPEPDLYCSKCDVGGSKKPLFNRNWEIGRFYEGYKKATDDILFPKESKPTHKPQESMQEENECCDDCHDIYTEHTYPIHTIHDACTDLSCKCHPTVAIPDWHKLLESLALTEPDPNKAYFNLPQLKGFISELLHRQDK